MPVVRYAALAALVFWLGGTTQALVGDVYARTTLVAMVSGAVVLVCFLIMKFVGPPPPAFLMRSALVIVMLLIAGVSAQYGPSRAAQALTLAIGLSLLAWYTPEP